LANVMTGVPTGKTALVV